MVAMSRRASPGSWVSPPLRLPWNIAARPDTARRARSGALPELHPERELVIGDALGDVLRLAPDLLAVLREHQAHGGRPHVRRHGERHHHLERAPVVLGV